MRWFILTVAVTSGAILVSTPRGGSTAADVPKPAFVAPKASVEYKVISTSELGITGGAGNGVFDYAGATTRLNQMAKDGWRYREIVTTGGPSGVLLERPVSAEIPAPRNAEEPPQAGKATAGPTLEVGKHYTFYWERGAVIDAVALDAPRGNWVKVRYRLDSGKDATHWVNLNTVTYFIELPATK